MADREKLLWSSVTETTWRFYLWAGALSAVVLWGLFAYSQQLRHGLIETGMRDQVSWGLYITNFVFFIGISHVGALLSAILRFSGAEWRRPLTRMAEAITTASLFVGGLMPVIDMGRPDRLLNLLRYPRIQSPILWDIISVTTYFTGSTLFLWVLLIPDIALLRDRFPQAARWRRKLYAMLSLRYYNTPEQHHLLERAIFAVTLVILPLAISVHTVVSWIFAMTLRPGWDSSIFGPYFVVGALYSGTASVILAMYIFRRVYRLEGYLEPIHFRNLGLLLLSLTMLYLYFNLNEYLTLGYKFQGLERNLLLRLFAGDYAFDFWCVQAMGVLIPMLLVMAVLGLKPYRQFTIPGVALASALVVAGAWVKRYIIIVPTLSSPYLPAQRLPWEWAHYRPTWVEWSITAAGFAGFLLIYSVLSKLFPIVSIWETRAAEVPEVHEGAPAKPSPWEWRDARLIGILLLAGLVAGATPARAAKPRQAKKPAPTTLSLEWQKPSAQVLAAAGAEGSGPEVPGPGRVFLFADRVFGRFDFGAPGGAEEKPAFPIAVIATLRDEKQHPLSFQAVSFSLQASFGTLSFGARPTDDQGRAQLILRDRRYGRFPVLVSYDGDEAHAASRAEIPVDFGLRPAPALPSQGVLIAPYPTAAIGLPFLIFYGIIWGVFLYAFGDLILWRMRRVSPPKR